MLLYCESTMYELAEHLIRYSINVVQPIMISLHLDKNKISWKDLI